MPHRYGNSHATWDHTGTCHPAEVTFPPLPQPKLVLDSATPEGWKAELTILLSMKPVEYFSVLSSQRTVVKRDLDITGRKQDVLFYLKNLLPYTKCKVVALYVFCTENRTQTNTRLDPNPTQLSTTHELENCLQSRIEVRPTALPRPRALDSAAASGLLRPRHTYRRASSQMMTSQWKPTTTAVNRYL